MGDNTPNTAQAVKPEDIAELRDKLGKIGEEVRAFGEEAVAKATEGTKLSGDLKEAVDKALLGQGELRERIKDLEQKADRRPGGDKAAADKTPGELFVENERVKEFMAKRDRGRVRIDMAAITTPGIGARNVLVQENRLPGIVMIPERRMTVRDLLTQGRTNSNAIQYVRETGFTNNANVVSEGDTKPESDLDFELITKNVTTIAHWMLASKQILDDAPMLQSDIDGRLRYGLAYVEEGELLNGDGTGAHLHGLIPQATAYSASFTPAMAQMIDTVRLAILQSELAYFPNTGIVLNPIDWARIELTKDGEGRYLFAQPQSMATPMLWARPVVATQAMAVDKFLTGAFKLGAQVFDREDANVEISTEDSDNFRKNLVTIRAEERLVLAVYRPEAFIYGDFGNVT